jgi:hypothetical protein
MKIDSRIALAMALVAGLAGGIAGAFVAGGCVRAAAPAPEAGKSFEGYGDGMSFDKAVVDAATKAFAELSKSPDWPKADGMLRFTVSEIGGERGGFAGLNRLRVKITPTP